MAPTTPLPERPAAVETEPAAAYSAEAEPSTPLDAKQRPKAEPATEQELAPARHLVRFADVLREVEADLLPHKLCEFFGT